MNLGCGTGHPSYVMSSSLRQPDPRADRAVHQQDKYPVGVYVLPKHLDEKVARLQLKKLNAMLTELTDEQAGYIGVEKAARTSPTPTGIRTRWNRIDRRASRLTAHAAPRRARFDLSPL